MDSSPALLVLRPTVYNPRAPVRAATDVDIAQSQLVAVAPIVFDPRGPGRSATAEPWSLSTSKSLPPAPESPFRSSPERIGRQDLLTSRPFTRGALDKTGRREPPDPVPYLARPLIATQASSVAPPYGSSRERGPADRHLSSSQSPGRDSIYDDVTNWNRKASDNTKVPRPAIQATIRSKRDTESTCTVHSYHQAPSRLPSLVPSTQPLARRSSHGLISASLVPPVSIPMPTLPSVLPTKTSIDVPLTRYMTMLLSLDQIPRWHGILAAISSWLVLVGFVAAPATFTNLVGLENGATGQNNASTPKIVNSVPNFPLLTVAGICIGVGITGATWLSLRWRTNYIWPLHRIYLPGMLNSLVGLVGTLAGVYGQQHGDWSVSSKMAVSVELMVFAVTGMLFVFYNHWLLARVKRQHYAEAGESGEKTLKDMLGALARRPPSPKNFLV